MRIAVIGAGYWGVNLVRVFSQMGVLSKICDFNADRLAQVASQFPGVATESSIDAVVHGPDVDAVAIATPAETHYALARQALLAGKDVYVEKPLTLHCDEAEKLTLLAESGGQILM